MSSGFVDLLQSRIYLANATNGSNILYGLSRPNIEPIELPYTAPNGSKVLLGDPEYGFPPMLYPNLTYGEPGTPVTAFPNVTIMRDRHLLLGPLQINDSYALISLTMPIIGIQNKRTIGYMTTVAAATSLFRLESSNEGMGRTGEILLLGPSTPFNRFGAGYELATRNSDGNATTLENALVDFVLPPVPQPGQPGRHESDSGNTSFPLSRFPIALQAFTKRVDSVNNASGTLDTHNERHHSVAVGFARPRTTLVDWLVVVEQTKDEAYTAIVTLKKILVGSVLGAVGFILLVIFPCAHFGVKPIRKLKAATEAAIPPPGYDFDLEQQYSANGTPLAPGHDGDKSPIASWLGHVKDYFALRTMRGLLLPYQEGTRHKAFRIPRKVEDKKHFIVDELTELTTTFNDMSDELFLQYTKLEDKVAERTRELEISKKAAEAANEAKTVFIANISHELKTPLNGILGMCAVCMDEDDVLRIKQSIKTVYESGNLLLRLLDDLLNFSRHQVVQDLALEEERFRLGDIGNQITALFDKQITEHGIRFSLTYIDAISANDDQKPPIEPDSKPKPMHLGYSTMALKEMQVWGDKHRLLQVLLNLVSNSLKFTPDGGSITVRIRCFVDSRPWPTDDSQSVASHNDSQRPRRGSKFNPRSLLDLSLRLVPSLAAAPNDRDPEKEGGTRFEISNAAAELDEKREDGADNGSPRPSSADFRVCTFEFDVEDTGPGIPEQMQQRVFEPFVQGDAGFNKKFGGAGLGLTICRQLVSVMGGSIRLKSAVGVGTTFTVQVPLRVFRNPPAAPPEFRKSPLFGSGRSRLSDDKSLRRLNADLGEYRVRAATPTSAASRHQAASEGVSKPDSISENARPSPEPNPPSDNSTAPPRQVSVLVADDNSTNLEVVSRMLKLENVDAVSVARVS